MDGRPTWTDCDEAGDYVVPNVLSPRDLVSRPDNMDETVPHKQIEILGRDLTRQFKMKSPEGIFQKKKYESQIHDIEIFLL